MIIRDVIDRVEQQRAGCDISLEEYISCLNILEEDIYTNIISAHEGKAEFDAHTSEDDTLLVPDMYADLYSFWLFARIDLANGDIGGYTNNMILYNNLMDEYSRYYTRSHMPKTKGRVRWC
ncbi:MAG: hypothetical protein IJB24_04235 [Clostridia bacterium]|nr:hypothetical protein [Clostridia bacterium]